MTDDIPAGFKMTELGPLPEKWEVEKLIEVLIKRGWRFEAGF